MLLQTAVFHSFLWLSTISYRLFEILKLSHRHVIFCVEPYPGPGESRTGPTGDAGSQKVAKSLEFSCLDDPLTGLAAVCDPEASKVAYLPLEKSVCRSRGHS